MPKRHFLIEGKYMGSSDAKPRVIHGTFAPPIGFGFYCPHCGRLWAEAPVDGAKHMVYTMMCHAHAPTAFDIPGSIYLPWEPELVAEFPPAVIRHELACHLNWLTSQCTGDIASNAVSVLLYLSTAK